MTDRELMQQTLEALNAVRLSGDVVVVVTPEKSIYIDPLRLALRERLAQPEQDAVLAEREACAALVDDNAMACHSPIYRSLLQSNAAAIRARGQK